jgi:hypothetical protein
MKLMLKDVLFGVLVFAAVMVCEFIVTLPFGEIAYESDRAEWAMLINREFLVTALPAALIAFASSFLLKTKSRKEAIRRGTIWVGVFVLLYILIGIGNHDLDLIFGTAGVYVVLACVFSGPVLYVVMTH